MPKDGDKKLLVIIDNLEEFAGKLVKLIEDESPEGREKLIMLMTQAKEKYKSPQNNWFTGRIYQVFRKRVPTVESAITEIEKSSDPVSSLKEFKSLVGVGEWNVGSFNYLLFLELINAIPGYEPIDDNIAQEIIIRLSDLTVEKIDQFIEKCLIKQQVDEQLEKEHQEAQLRMQELLSTVTLYNSLDGAKQCIQTSQDKLVFCLRLQDNKWKLTWFDFMGKTHVLDIGEELSKILEAQKPENIEELDEELLCLLKEQCLKARDLLLDKTLLYVQQNDLSTKKYPCFLLNIKENNYSLDWINALEKSQAIKLEKYPELKEWLENSGSLEESISGENLLKLKTYLLQVNVTQPLAQDEFKKQLQVVLKQGPTLGHKKQAPVANTEIKTLNMDSFSAINQLLSKRLESNIKPKVEPKLQPKPTQAIKEAPIQKPQIGRLNLAKYSAIANMLGNRPGQVIQNLETKAELGPSKCL